MLSRVMVGTILEHLTWQEAEPLLASGRIAILPIGARLKEHGPHLPLNNDWLMAEYLAQRVAACCEVILLPTLPFGYYPSFVEYPGSISIACETMAETVCDVARSLGRHGSKKLYALNTGISTNWALEPARQRLRHEGLALEYTDLCKDGLELQQRLCSQPCGSHADEVETSMMLYIAPQVVDMRRAERAIPEKTRAAGPLTRRHDNPSGIFSPSGAYGDPTLATRAKGEQFVEDLVGRICAFLKDFARADFKQAPAEEKYLAARS